ncbi:amidohydrolase family protein [Frankia sp. Cppng1_Ct_nod]|uniref:amidohydrolase family protein n=1 Tax=Frankia sp. Cppng1_Ct_nod TaxID=2897162 RepID=UPI001040EC3B|nr:amidohydrolase family protein [Frankia sp. Cppng1_Ct_nod]
MKPQRVIKKAGLAVLRSRIADPPLSRWDPQPTLRVPASDVRQAAYPAVDAHNHLGRWLRSDDSWMVDDVGALLAMMDELNLATIINLDGRWGGELEANLDRYDRPHPGRFVTYCHLDWTLLRGRRPSDALVAQLHASAAVGARGLKVWKDLGMRVRDGRGRLVLPDDPRLADVFEAAGELGLPVLIHVGDPVAFFRRPDRHNERLDELRRHPTAARRVGVNSAPGRRGPGLPRLLGALEAVVAAHPATTFVGAHVGCLAEDLGEVTRMLDAYPNLCIDVSARAAELGRQPRVARRFIERFADRVLFGTDSFPPAADGYRAYFRLLETDDDHFAYSTSVPPPQGRWAAYGLDLSADVLRRVYAGNAARLLPGVPPSATTPSATLPLTVTPPARHQGEAGDG